VSFLFPKSLKQCETHLIDYLLLSVRVPPSITSRWILLTRMERMTVQGKILLRRKYAIAAAVPYTRCPCTRVRRPLDLNMAH
jgi:hypothetical protein